MRGTAASLIDVTHSANHFQANSAWLRAARRGHRSVLPEGYLPVGIYHCAGVGDETGAREEYEHSHDEVGDLANVWYLRPRPSDQPQHPV